MSTPPNGAARNQMRPFERQCYDWGWEEAELCVTNILEEEVSNLENVGQYADAAYLRGIIEHIGMNMAQHTAFAQLVAARREGFSTAIEVDPKEL